MTIQKINTKKTIQHKLYLGGFEAFKNNVISEIWKDSETLDFVKIHLFCQNIEKYVVKPIEKPLSNTFRHIRISIKLGICKL